MKNTFLIIISFISQITFCQPGTLVSDQLLDEYELADVPVLLSQLGIPSFLVNQNFGVELYKLTYLTKAPLGDSLILASAFVTVPKSTTYEFPLFHYNAGTRPYEENLSNLENEALALAMLAIEGNISMAPDYIGYGDSPLNIPHPYLHAETEANAGIDLLKAAHTFLDSIGVHTNNKLVLGGYSQGAHAALALQRSLQENNPENYEIVGTYVGAGPYDLSGPVIDSVLTGSPIEGYFFPFLLESYQYMYGDVYSSLEEIYASPWDSLIPRAFSKTDPLTVADLTFPPSPIYILTPDYLLDLQTDTNHIVRQHLKTNDLHKDWFPTTSTSLYHCTEDNFVPIESTENTYNAFLDAGAQEIEFIENSTPGILHSECFSPYLLNLKLYLVSISSYAPVGLSEANQMNGINWYSEGQNLIITSELFQQQMVSISTIQGRIIFQDNVSNELEIPMGKLPKGCYIINVGDFSFKYLK